MLLITGVICRYRELQTEYRWAQQSLLWNEEKERPVTEWTEVRQASIIMLAHACDCFLGIFPRKHNAL